MASIVFLDSSGVSWRAWSTVPISGAVINPGFEKGWLTFESGTGELRRLAPIPADWEGASVERLIALCQKADAVPRHTGPFQRPTRPVLGSDDPGGSDAADRR